MNLFSSFHVVVRLLQESTLNKFTISPQLSQHCRGLVIILLRSDFHIKLKLTDNKDTTFTSSQHVHNHMEARLKFCCNYKKLLLRVTGFRVKL